MPFATTYKTIYKIYLFNYFYYLLLICNKYIIVDYLLLFIITWLHLNLMWFFSYFIIVINMFSLPYLIFDLMLCFCYIGWIMKMVKRPILNMDITEAVMVITLLKIISSIYNVLIHKWQELNLNTGLLLVITIDYLLLKSRLSGCFIIKMTKMCLFSSKPWLFMMAWCIVVMH